LAALASHTSGLPNYPDNLGGPDGGIDPLSPASGYSRASLRTFLQGWAPDSGAVLYSNLGFGLLGLAVTDTLNAGNYHDALETLITGPLEMSSTWGQISAIPSDALPRVVQGHTANRGWVNGRLADIGALAGGGEIASTGHDMARLMRAVVGLDTSPLESAITIALVPLARVSSGKDIGYGVGIEHRDGGDVFTKDGFTPSYSAFMIFSRQPAVGVAILTGCGKPFPVESVTRALFEQILATQN
jgi:CubicO group peptidase (beta-lactamase class C family)